MKIQRLFFLLTIIATMALLSSCGSDNDPDPVTENPTTIDKTPFIQLAGKGSKDQSKAITVDKSGNTYVTGNFTTATLFGTIEITGSSYDNMFVAKYDTKGKAIWAKSVAGTNNITGSSICWDATGNIYVTGYFVGTADFGAEQITANGNQDFFVAKYKDSGELIWVKNAGASSSEAAAGIETDASGNIYVIGSFNTATTIGTTNMTSFGLGDIFLAKYSAGGDVVWAKHVGGGTNYDNGYDVTIDKSNNIYLTGLINKDVTIGSSSLTGSASDVLLAKYNSAGDFQWAKRTSGEGANISGGYGVDTDKDGNIYVTGIVGNDKNFGGETGLSVGPNHYGFLAKYNTSGTIQWVQGLYGSGTDYGFAVDENGNAFVINTFWSDCSYNGFNLLSAGKSDIAIIKFNKSGDPQWAMPMMGNDYETPAGLCLDPSNNLYVTGYFSSSSIFTSEGELNLVGTSDMFVWKVSQPLN
jgi:hypothetical protein